MEKAIYIKESYKPLIKESYLEADELIAVGNGLKKEISKFCGRKDIKVIHNLIPIENFYISKNKNKNFTFFSLAFLEGEKGMDTLIRSYAKYLKETNSKLLIGGDGSQKDFLIKLCEELEIKNQVEFLGALSRKEVSHYMSICDSFVLASRYETFGVVYIEALASGKPIIGTYNGGAEDIINSKNGLIVKVDDVDELGNAMKYIMENSNFYNAEDIRIDCIEKFSKEKITNEILDIYDLVLDKRG